MARGQLVARASNPRGVSRCAIRCAIGVRIDASHFSFDPLFHTRIHLVGREPGCLDRLADRHRDYTRIFDERVAGPDTSRVVRDWHDGGVRGDRKARATGLVFALLARRRARALREHDDPRAFGHARLALARHGGERVFAFLTVDVNHLQHAQRPAEERHVEQFALEHEAQRTRHQRRKRHRFPCRLVLRKQYGWSVGQVLHALDAVANAVEPARDEHRRAAPAHGHPVAPSGVHERERDEACRRVGDRVDDQINEQQQGADEAHRLDRSEGRAAG